MFSKSQVQNLKEDWSRGSPTIPPVLSNKNFIIFKFFIFFVSNLVLGVFESYYEI